MILETVEPGIEYEVPSIYDTVDGRWVPVFPKPHADQDKQFFINVEEHYHVDNRFIVWPNPGTVLRASGRKLVNKPFVCLKADLEPVMVVWMQMALYQVFAEHKLHDCKVCPHKGMPILNGVCAGHGLRWGDDGRVKHKGPFQVRIAETANVAPVPDLIRLKVEIVERYHGPFHFHFVDCDGAVVTRFRDDMTTLDCEPGDTFHIQNTNYGGFSE